MQASSRFLRRMLRVFLVRTEPASALPAAEALAEPAPELLEPAAPPEVLEGSLIVRVGNYRSAH